jgi:lipoate-protein ligase A
VNGARLLPFAFFDPATNMGVDAALLELAGDPVLRLYGWRPHALSLGYFQRIEDAPAGLRDAGLPVVRRMTGGGAILHAYELTYALVLPLDHPWVRGLPVGDSYHRIHEAVLDALRSLRVPATTRAAPGSDAERPFLCFSRTAETDLAVDGRKLLGSAQRRTRTHLLQHGSLLIRSHPLQPKTASLSDALGQEVDPADVAAALEAAFAKRLGPLASGALTPEEAVLSADRAASARALGSAPPPPRGGQQPRRP